MLPRITQPDDDANKQTGNGIYIYSKHEGGRVNSERRIHS